jgi:hypothetical protein
MHRTVPLIQMSRTSKSLSDSWIIFYSLTGQRGVACSGSMKADLVKPSNRADRHIDITLARGSPYSPFARLKPGWISNPEAKCEPRGSIHADAREINGSWNHFHLVLMKREQR